MARNQKKKKNKNIRDQTFPKKSYVSLNINICICTGPRASQPKASEPPPIYTHAGKDPRRFIWRVEFIRRVGRYPAERYAYLFFLLFPFKLKSIPLNKYLGYIPNVSCVCVCVFCVFIHTNINQRHQNNALNKNKNNKLIAVFLKDLKKKNQVMGRRNPNKIQDSYNVRIMSSTFRLGMNNEWSKGLRKEKKGKNLGKKVWKRGRRRRK